MFPTTLFAAWRPIWETSEEVRTIGARADQLASARNALAIVVPDSSILERFREALYLFNLLYKARGEPKRGREREFVEAYSRAIQALRPLIQAARWPRWLQLEEALAATIDVSGFLAAALLLRTQIEDLAIQLEIEVWDRKLAHEDWCTSGYISREDCARIREYASLLKDHILPQPSASTRDELATKCEFNADALLPADLQECRKRLNDYVHPNYGSHLAIIRPEESRAGEVLLHSFACVYEAFLRMDGTRSLPASREFPVAPEHPSAVQEWKTFLERTLPGIDAHMPPPEGWERWRPDFVRSLVDQLTNEEEQRTFYEGHAEDASEGSESATIPSLAKLCCSLIPAATRMSSSDVVRFPLEHPEFGLPASLSAWLVFPAVRDYADQLDKMVAELDRSALFPQRPPYEHWLTFLRNAIEMSIVLTQIKTDSMMLATLRMLNGSNPLGAAVCARSLLEHYAVGLYVSLQLNRRWDGIEGAQSDGECKSKLDKLEKHVARFLAGTSSTEELSRAWRERWNKLGTAQHLDLGPAIKEAFPGNDFRQFLWCYFSNITHGSQLTGADLLEPRSTERTRTILALAVLVFANLQSREADLDIVAPALLPVDRLRRLGGSAGKSGMADLRKSILEGKMPARLEMGRDVFGSGIESNPYRFRPSLNYYQAYAQFCREQGISIQRRCVWNWEGEIGDRVTTTDSREIFFRKGSFFTFFTLGLILT